MIGQRRRSRRTRAAKKQLPELDGTAKFYIHSTLRARPRGFGIELYRPRLRKEGRRGAAAVVTVAALVGLLFWLAAT